MSGATRKIAERKERNTETKGENKLKDEGNGKLGLFDTNKEWYGICGICGITIKQC